MTPSLVTLLFAVLYPALNHALALPVRSPPTGQMGALMPNLSLLHRGGNTKVGWCSLKMRGGDDDSESDGYEYDDASSSDEEELIESEDDEEDLDDDAEPSDEEKTKEIELMYKKAELQSQSRNFAIATALWSSLFFDSILNKVKRNDLFPAAIVQGADVINPAAALASGFAISSCVAFLLWRDLDIRSETLGGEESQKGDWFLSLSSSNNDEDAETEAFASETRQRLLTHLSLFGIINLGAHAGLLFSDQAPFLGMSAAIINVHNTLACLSALVKEKSLSGLIAQAVSWPISLFKSGRGEGAAKKEGMISYLFRLSAVAAWMRCIPVCKSLFALAMGAAAVDTIKIVDKARELSLTVAYLARLTLTAGVAKTLYAASASSIDSIRNHPFFATLSGMLSMICFGVGGTMLYSSLILNVSVSKALLGESAILMLFALVAGYNSITSFLASKSAA